MLRLVPGWSRTVDVTKRIAVHDGVRLWDGEDAGGGRVVMRPPKYPRRVNELMTTNCLGWWLHSWSHSNPQPLPTNSNVQSAVARRLQRQHLQKRVRKSISPIRHYCWAVDVVDEVV